MLKRVLLLTTVFISACISSTPVKFDYNAVIIQDLPAEVALRFLKQLKNWHDDIDRRSPASNSCVYNLKTMSAGETGQRPYSEFRVIIIEYGNDINNAYLFVSHDTASLTFRNKKDCGYYFDRDTAIKTATALKSLGAKIPE